MITASRRILKMQNEDAWLLWVKKATGLGVTEFFLRFMAWLCLRNNDKKGNDETTTVLPSATMK